MARGPHAVLWVRHRRNGEALGLQDAGGDGMGLLRRDGVAQSLEAGNPLAGRGEIYPCELCSLSARAPEFPSSPWARPSSTLYRTWPL